SRSRCGCRLRTDRSAPFQNGPRRGGLVQRDALLAIHGNPHGAGTSAGTRSSRALHAGLRTPEPGSDVASLDGTLTLDCCTKLHGPAPFISAAGQSLDSTRSRKLLDSNPSALPEIVWVISSPSGRSIPLRAGSPRCCNDRASKLRPRVEGLGAENRRHRGTHNKGGLADPLLRSSSPVALEEQRVSRLRTLSCSGQEGRRPQTARVITRCMELSNGYPAHPPPHFLRGGRLGWP